MRELPISFEYDSLARIVMGTDGGDWTYYKTTFQLKREFFGKTVIEIVSTHQFNAIDTEENFLYLEDERTGEVNCIEVALIDGFKQEVFDAESYNESL